MFRVLKTGLKRRSIRTSSEIGSVLKRENVIALIFLIHIFLGRMFVRILLHFTVILGHDKAEDVQVVF